MAARLLDGTPISPGRARQIALNAGVSTLLLGPGDLPLRLGRTVRFATSAQRRALLAMYESCCVLGCQIPAHLCEIHHLDGGWKLGTPTDLDRLVPACGWHNRWIEDHTDQIIQTRDTRGRTILEILPAWHDRQRAAAAGRAGSQGTHGHRQPGAP
ncbi:hypothetical protein ACRYCC_40330 [Actinomadura scrupuli]|uniref:hypothetical protein n=1 Tax=Actinomadura scrupuli TaxID=559629 RepID=UPI003D97578B